VQLPPQSTSVSVPLSRLSPQLEAASHVPALQEADTQSVLRLQCLPAAQA
jgi:hypothetical protein